MRIPFADNVEFFRQFRTRFETTGAIAPSSRFLARAMTGPLSRRKQPVRVLEVGPGTGAVTRRIVRLLERDDRFDLVELNESFAAILNDRFQTDSFYRRAAAQSQVHVCPVQEFRSDGQFDFIISGLPLNNFSAGLVQEIFETFFRLLAPGGVLSYFEYMYVRPFRKLLAKPDEKSRLVALDEIANSYQSRHRLYTSWVFVNLPPAWVQHLQKEGGSESGRPIAQQPEA